MIGEQRMILSVMWGPQAGLKVALAPGQRLRVGRTELSDVVIPRDDQLLAVHFELHHDGAACTIRDLGGKAGVRVGGLRVTEGEVAHGAWIRAGSTDFRLLIEGGAPRRKTIADDETPLARQAREEAAARAARAADALVEIARTERLHAVLDASRDDRILELLACSIDQHRTLYEGLRGETLAEVAPYLVRFSPGSPLLPRLVKEGWGERWGIFLIATQQYNEIRRQLRRFLMVEDDRTGQELYFRFYDPAVLGVFLPTCPPRQAGELWTGIDSFLFEDEEGELVRVDRAEALAAAMELAKS